jgi:hypothetical protein
MVENLIRVLARALSDDILELSGDNYKIWKERILLMKWIFMKSGRGLIVSPLCSQTPKYMLVSMVQSSIMRMSRILLRTLMSSLSRANTLILKFSIMKLTEVRGVRDHIMCMSDITVQLNDLEITMSDYFLVHYILCTLPHQYGSFKISYNTHKNKWSVNELLTMCCRNRKC